jgi:hypothetical protein
MTILNPVTVPSLWFMVSSDLLDHTHCPVRALLVCFDRNKAGRG